MWRVQLAEARKFCFSATFGIFQFLKYFGSGTVAYFMVPGSSTRISHNELYSLRNGPNLSQHEM